MTRKKDKQDRWQGTAATQHADGESMLPVEKALANVSVLPSLPTQVYLDSLSCICEQAEMRLNKQASSLNVILP
jgi:hypothetical protein